MTGHATERANRGFPPRGRQWECASMENNSPDITDVGIGRTLASFVLTAIGIWAESQVDVFGGVGLAMWLLFPGLIAALLAHPDWWVHSYIANAAAAVLAVATFAALVALMTDPDEFDAGPPVMALIAFIVVGAVSTFSTVIFGWLWWAVRRHNKRRRESRD